MNIPFITKWFKQREAKEQIEHFIKLQQRKATIIRLRQVAQDSK